MTIASSVGREEKVPSEPRMLASGSSVNVEDLVEVNKCSWMEFVEDKLVFCVEL